MSRTYTQMGRTLIPPSSEELSRYVAQLKSEMKGKDMMIYELRVTVDELADAVAKIGRHAQSQIRG